MPGSDLGPGIKDNTTLYLYCALQLEKCVSELLSPYKFHSPYKNVIIYPILQMRKLEEQRV